MLALSIACIVAVAPVQFDAEAALAQAKSLQSEGRFQESRALLERVVATLSKAGPAKTILLFDARNSLATAHRRFGETAKAIELLESLIKDVKRWKDPRAAGLLAVCMNNLATAYRFADRNADARRIWEQQITVGDDDDTAIALDNLTSLMLDSELNDLGIAQVATYAKRANDLWARIEGTDSVNYAISLAVKGVIEMRRHKFVEARTLLGRSLALQKKLRGSAHPDVGNVMMSLGVNELADGRRDQARDYFREALAISERWLAPDHPQIAQARAGLAMVDR